MELTVVIPTRDRLATLRETLTRLERQEGDSAFEVIVVDDGSNDGTPNALREAAPRFPLSLLENGGRGPASARNRAIEAARGAACLFINDDTWPAPGLVARHAAFHRRHPEPAAALLGRIALAAEPPPTPLMRWLADQHFDLAVEDPEDIGGRRFFTANVSAKTAFLREAGGFDEGFPAAAHEDVDLGLRLERRGLRLAYDAEAVVEHSHPFDLPRAIDRMREVGWTLAPFVERHPGWPVPRRPGLRHRVKALALTPPAAARATSPRLRREIWRFLCHEATREGYWDAVEGRERGWGAAARGPRIGRTLARIAARDEEARLPATAAAASAPRRPAA
ncbi:MAG TPA: glycosyltransferase family 2 protein [Thermoleophilaceae bacterium]